MTAKNRLSQASAEQTRRTRRSSLAAKASAITPQAGDSPWSDHEFVRGYAVMVLPFSTGHLLALRVWPQSSFGPYVSVWHRPPGGEWSIYSDGPSLDTTCPRYWGPATEEAALANIDVTWTGSDELRVEMDDPQLIWTLSVSAPPLLERLNAVHASLPLWTWKPSLFVRTRELLAKQVFDIGDVRFSFRTASGHDTVIMPEEEYAIPDSDATLEGQSLGSPTQLRENPTIGDVPLPTHPCFVFGEAHMRIKNPGEFQRTRERIRDTASRSNTV